MRGRRLVNRSFCLVAALAAYGSLTSNCSKSTPQIASPTASVFYPRFTPALKAATPAALGGYVSLTWSAKPLDLMRNLFQDGVRELLPEAWSNNALPAAALQQNFFQNGAADIWRILSQVDNLIADVNLYSGTSCSGTTPIPYAVTVFSGTPGVTRTFQMYAQCYQLGTPGFPGDPALTLIGTSGGITYIWSPSGASWVLATQDQNSNLHILYGVGYNNGAAAGGCGTTGQWDDCSYGVAEIATNVSVGSSGQIVLPTAPMLEMTGAGINIGYCGIQFVTDGTNVFGTGSAASSGNTCSPQEDLCAPASNITGATVTGGICSASYAQFKLPPIGMTAATGVNVSTYAASQYPGAPGITLNGTATDTIHFAGPLSPPAGIPAVVFQGMPASPPSPTPVLLDMPIPSTMDSSVRVDNVYVSSSYPNAATTLFGPHPGIHYSPLSGAQAQMSYYAMAAGTITDISPYYSTNLAAPPTGPCTSSGSTVCSWNLNVTLAVSPVQNVIYQFETMAGGPADLSPLNAQLAAMAPGLQTAGSHLSIAVNKGDLIGTLVGVTGSASPILHLGFAINNTLTCPTPYLSSDALTRTMNILTRDEPTWQLCYGN